MNNLYFGFILLKLKTMDSSSRYLLAQLGTSLWTLIDRNGSMLRRICIIFQASRLISYRLVASLPLDMRSLCRSIDSSSSTYLAYKASLQKLPCCHLPRPSISIPYSTHNAIQQSKYASQRQNANPTQRMFQSLFNQPYTFHTVYYTSANTHQIQVQQEKKVFMSHMWPRLSDFSARTKSWPACSCHVSKIKSRPA